MNLIKTNSAVFAFCIIVSISLTISGCQHAMVEQEIEKPYKSRNISIVDKTAKRDSGSAKWYYEFSSYLKEKIYDDSTFKQGKNLTLEYDIIQLDAGDRAGRIFSFGLAGGGEFKVRVTFLDAKGKVIAIIRSEKKTSGGLLTSGFSQPIELAVKEIISYVNDNFAYDD
ncbi:MAG: hypothetical protein ABI840_13260 [bacterium]